MYFDILTVRLQICNLCFLPSWKTKSHNFIQQQIFFILEQNYLSLHQYKRPLHVQVFGILLFCYSGILLNQLTFFDFYFWVVPIVWYILGIFLFDIISYFYALLHSFALLYYSINKKKIIELRKLTSHGPDSRDNQLLCEFA